MFSEENFSNLTFELDINFKVKHLQKVIEIEFMFSFRSRGNPYCEKLKDMLFYFRKTAFYKQTI